MALGVILLTGLASAVADYTIAWYSVDGGSSVCTGGDYALSGSLGQAEATETSGGTYTLTGGFWIGCIPGDSDCDGDVDLNDYDTFAACLEGPGCSLGAGCGCFDFDEDGDVDLADFAEFQVRFVE
jgi:hypothetical protein